MLFGSDVGRKSEAYSAIPAPAADIRRNALRFSALQRICAAGGVRIAGIDLSHPLAAADKTAIDAALLAHHVVVFPGQALTREQQYAFATTLGTVGLHGEHRAEHKRRDVAHVMTNLDAGGSPTIRQSPAGNHHWHTDKPYLTAPPALTLLYAVEIPPLTEDRGGDTEFANMALAYEALPDHTKRRIAGLRVAFRPAFDRDARAVDHPLVRTHPETGCKSLYLGNHETHIIDMPATESGALLRDLLDHATRRPFVYAHRWRVGDLVVWDNRCLLHRLVLGEALRHHRRVMYRSIVRGTVPI